MKQITLLLFLSSLAAACGQNSSRAAAYPEPSLYRLMPGELVLAASEGDIPALDVDDSYFVPAEKADLDPQDLVVGLFTGGESRAYPIRLLSLHEVVNDKVGDLALAVTWCPLCHSAVVYQREVEGVELEFRASGYLLHDNLVLIDHPTDTLWSQLLGQGIKGALKNTLLETVPSTLTTWSIWKENYPRTLILSAERIGYEGDIPDPYGGYFNSGAIGLGGAGEIDSRLEAKDLVLGISIGDLQMAYPLVLIQEERLIEDYLEGYLVRILWDTDLQAPRISLSDGSMETELPGQTVYWFAWSALHPKTGVYFPE